MNLSQLSTIHLKRIGRLIEMKEELMLEIAQIDAGLLAMSGAQHSPLLKLALGRKVGRPAGAPSAGRGELKAAIIKLLKQAGGSGTTVKAVAASLGINAGNVYVWFFGTGKRVKEIKKVGRAKYAWVG